MAQWNVEHHAHAAAFLGRRDQRRALAENLAKGRSKLRMKDGGGVFKFAILANRRRLAIALDVSSGDAQCRHRARGQKATQLLANVDEGAQVFLIFAREGIGDHRNGGGAA